MREAHERLQWARERAGFETATEAARALGVAEPTYLGHENGRRGFRRVADKYARRFGVSLEWLLTGRAPVLKAPSEQPRLVPASLSVTLREGEVFQVVLGSQSVCCYLAAAGGIAVPLVLGSASTYVRAAIGGLSGRALRQGAQAS